MLIVPTTRSETVISLLYTFIIYISQFIINTGEIYSYELSLQCDGANCYREMRVVSIVIALRDSDPRGPDAEYEFLSARARLAGNKFQFEFAPVIPHSRRFTDEARRF